MRIILKCQKFSLRVLLSICLIFLLISAWVAYKSVAYKTKRALNKIQFHASNKLVIARQPCAI